MTDRRVPPHDNSAETNLIGIAILDNKKIPDLISMVSPGDFYTEKNRLMWEGIVTLAAREKEVGIAPLYEYLEGKVSMTDIAKVIDGVPKSADAAYYAKIVREKSLSRKVIEAAYRLSEAAHQGDTDEMASLITGLSEGRIQGRRERVISEDVQKWVETTASPFSISDCVNSIQGMTQRERPAIRTILHRLKDRGILEAAGRREGIYRLIQNNCPEMDWRNAPDNELPFKLPLGLNDLVSLYGKSLIIIAGQSNQGKSAVILNIIKDNMNEFPIHYFTSEFGPSKMKKRFSLFDDVQIDAWKVKVYARAHDFHDAIHENDVNVIDWLWSGTSFYEAGGDLERIFNKLREGIAIVALQKDPGREYGRGGAITMDYASLYLSIFPGEARIVKAKDWKTDDNPNGKVLKLKIIHGAVLVPGAEGWQYQESLEMADKSLGKGRRLFK